MPSTFLISKEVYIAKANYNPPALLNSWLGPFGGGDRVKKISGKQKFPLKFITEAKLFMKKQRNTFRLEATITRELC